MHPTKQEPEQLPATGTAGAEAATAVDARGSKPPAVRYLGFRTTAAGREYTLRATDDLETRLFVLLIPHEVFASRAARYQDAPDLCFARLQRDLVADPGLPAGPRLVLTARELLEYRDALERRAPGRKRRSPAS